jgi:chromosomal replication initiation ATPase DnaA
MARNAAIYFVQRYTGLKNEEIGEIFGGIHYSAVSKAACRFKQEMADNKQIEKLIKAVNSKIKA